MKRDFRLYINDICQAIESIEQYVEGMSFEEFGGDQKTIDAVVRNLEIIGEASKTVPDQVKQSNPEVPWKEMAGMRDKLIHAYFGINVETIWKTIKTRLPELRRLLWDIKQ